MSFTFYQSFGRILPLLSECCADKIPACSMERGAEMDIKDIRCFWRVYEERSINKAAKQLFITPQGLSKLIQNLEEELGTVLFERSSRGMMPTAGGTYLYRNCSDLLDKFEEIQVGLRRIKEQDKKLKLGFSCGVLNVFPLCKLDELKNVFRDIVIEWDECSNEEVRVSLQKGECDIGFVIGRITDANLWAKEIFSRKLDVIVYKGHRFYGRDSLSVGELRQEQFITLNEKFYCYYSFLQRCSDFGFTPDIVLKTMESQLIYRFCQQKIGLGIDVDIHDKEMNYGNLKRIALYDSIPWKISLAIRKDRKDEPRIQKAMQIFR